ncbi:AsmA protein [Granulicella rosea]|uniref:AsmA protein n=1 Tax=Granulicella rosea TaxID=474952 RepID=A0A239K9M1_9BACT|nr:AsmA family protein [Granulicella rosea]SNT14382.1 AsmA protein [Granulicella rosea]
MQEIHDRLAEDDNTDAGPLHGSTLRRVILGLFILLAIVLLIVVPPLVNVSRYQKRIAERIGEGLGRPVHLDNVTLTMLPLPGFELTNFVVGEDPAFGSEPVIRANTVRATLRVSSLWRRRVEFSKIAFDDTTSVNLVHLPDGRWNLESILLQASRMQAAPTAQKAAGEAPRFPYIEATGARLNLKQGFEKLPISLTDADFALWLPEPEHWQIRLEAHPTRTDTSVSDTGTLRVEGTLGRASSLAAVPIDLNAEWKNAPLGAVSWIVANRDAGVRGELTLNVSARGTVGQNTLKTRLQLKNSRRADFVPEHPLNVDLACEADTTMLFHVLDNVHCAWPAGSVKTGLQLTGAIPDILHPSTARGILRIAGVPASTVLEGLRIASGRIPAEVSLAGTVEGQIAYPLGSDPADHIDAPSDLGLLRVPDAVLSMGGGAPFVTAPIIVRVDAKGLTLEPQPIDLGAKEPATLEASFSETGYNLHLSGSVLKSRLTSFGAAIPQIGDGLSDALPAAPDSAAETPFHLDLTTERAWGSKQDWTPTTAAPHAPEPKARGKRKR